MFPNLLSIRYITGRGLTCKDAEPFHLISVTSPGNLAAVMLCCVSKFPQPERQSLWHTFSLLSCVSYADQNFIFVDVNFICASAVVLPGISGV